MKKTTIFFLMISFVFVQGQVKSEPTTKPTFEQTIIWIIEKLNSNSSYKRFYYGEYYDDDKNYNFSYDQFKKAIVVVYESRSYKKGEGQVGEKSIFTDYIPVNKLNKIEYQKSLRPNINKEIYDEYLSISVYEKSITHYYEDINKISMSSIIIPINFNNEENLFTRMKKAFDDLKSFFPKKQEAY